MTTRMTGWRPRFPERETQCASCPFLEGNDEQFGKIVNALRAKDAELHGKKPPKPASPAIIKRARASVKLDVLCRTPDFACHASVYGPEMKVGDPRDWRQCPGATKLAREIEKE